MKFKTLIAAIAAIAVLGTITVGAATDWTYSEAIGKFFRNSERFAEELDGQPNYTLAENTFKGVDFQLSGLYANGGIVLLEIDVIADKDIFSDYDDEEYGNGSMIFGSFQFQEGKDFPDIYGSVLRGNFYGTKISDRHFKAFHSYCLIDDIYIGEEMTYEIIAIYAGEGLEGSAEIKFSLSPEQLESFEQAVKAFPDAEFSTPDRDLTVEQLSLKANTLAVHGQVFRNEAEKSNAAVRLDVSLKFKDGEIMPIEEFFEEGSITFRQLLMEDESYQNFKHFTTSYIFKETPIDIYAVEAVIINGVEIPVN